MIFTISACIILVAALAMLISKRRIFALLCFFGTVAWTALAILVILFSGWGDGSAGDAITGGWRWVVFLPSIYLILLIAAFLRFIPAWLAHTILLAAIALFVVFSILFLRSLNDLKLFTIPFAIYALAAYWPWMSRRFMKASDVKVERKD